jgi:hypothetical protein
LRLITGSAASYIPHTRKIIGPLFNNNQTLQIVAHQPPRLHTVLTCRVLRTLRALRAPHDLQLRQQQAQVGVTTYTTTCSTRIVVSGQTQTSVQLYQSSDTLLLLNLRRIVIVWRIHEFYQEL